MTASKLSASIFAQVSVAKLIYELLISDKLNKVRLAKVNRNSVDMKEMLSHFFMVVFQVMGPNAITNPGSSVTF